MMATVATSLELHVPAARMWTALKDAPTFIPKAAPFFWLKWQVLQGSATTVDSLMLFTFNPATRGGLNLDIKARVADFDDEEMHVTYECLLDSDPLYRQMKVTISVDPAEGASTCVVTWSAFYEAVDESQGPPPLEVRRALLKGMEAYLLSHDDYLPVDHPRGKLKRSESSAAVVVPQAAGVDPLRGG